MEKNANLEARNASVNSEFNDYRVKLDITTAATKAGVTASAIDDVVSRAIVAGFAIDKTGHSFALDSEGAVLKNADDNPLDAATFIKDLETSAPHFWKQSKSGDLQGTDKNLDTKLSTITKNKDMAAFRKLRASK